jgi:hypothetical protein
MAFTLTEKVRAKLGSTSFALWKVTALAAGANNSITAEALGFKDIVAAAFTGNTVVTSAGTVAPPMTVTYKGTGIVINAATAADTGTLKVWGS